MIIANMFANRRGAFFVGLLLIASNGCSDSGANSNQDAGTCVQQIASKIGESACQVAVSQVPNEGATHVQEGSALTPKHNPPASGNHYPVWPHYQMYDKVVPRGYWIHGLEHGGIVLLYRPDAGADIVTQLKAVYDAIPDDPTCEHKRAIFTADPDLDDNIAVIAWDWVLEAECVNQGEILKFVCAHRGNAPEDVCNHGSYD